MRRVTARVNTAAIERNCARLAGTLTGGAALCAVVKADGYGHGALASARAALAAGAGWLAVVDSREALELRAAGLLDVPVLVMGALSEEELAEALRARADVVIWSERQLRAVRALGGGRVHVKLDTGMGRLGTRDGAEASALAQQAAAAEEVQLIGAMTHFATADEPEDGGFMADQLGRFLEWALPLRSEHPGLLLHAANSAATLREPASHLDMVRCGVAIYGLDPFGEDPGERDLEPALELVSHLADVKECAPGQSAGYGRRFSATAPTWLGLVPVGYGDGWRRALGGEAEVLVRARRRPLVGTVSMDSFAIDLGGEDARALQGEQVTLIGGQGPERITAEELARLLGTINYEITCALTPRVPRLHHRDGSPAATDGASAAQQTAARL